MVPPPPERGYQQRGGDLPRQTYRWTCNIYTPKPQGAKGKKRGKKPRDTTSHGNPPYTKTHPSTRMVRTRTEKRSH